MPTPSSSNHLFVVSAPSGAGKTSLVKALVHRLPALKVSTSHTTRARRPNEEDGREYFFIDREAFDRMVGEGAFLEHARVFDNFYGTGLRQLEEKLAAGHDVVLEIDWQGAQQIRRAMPQVQSIFILPPSRTELERRLRDRRTDSDEVIARRLRDSIADMSHWNEFDYVVVNDGFERAVSDLQAIIDGAGEQLRRDRFELRTLIGSLLG